MDLDLDAFWQENQLCEAKPFSTDKPRCAISFGLDDHWLLEEMQLPSTLRFYHDPEYRAAIHKRCNDRVEPALGLRPFPERPAPTPILRIEQVFASHFEYTEGATPWLEPAVQTIDQLRDLLGRLEKLDDRALRQLIFSTGGVVDKQPLNPDGSKKTRAAGSRGPATIGTSVMGTMNWAYWLEDFPADMDRFYQLLADVLIRYHRILEQETNVVYRGYSWLDDNCCLLSAPAYERYCFPVLKKVFDAFCPDEADWRYQHSDSAMGHLMPLLNRLDFDMVNFGPTLRAQDIRQQMPRTVIQGQVAPMTVRNGTPQQIAAEVQRDFAAAGADGGLVIATAGSIPGGTSLAKLRAFMLAVQQYTRYQ